MTHAEAAALLPLFSAVGLWVRVHGEEPNLLLEVRDDALYGLRVTFRERAQAHLYLMQC